MPAEQFSNREITSMFENVNTTIAHMGDNLADHVKTSKEAHATALAVIQEIQRELRESNGWKNKFMGAIGVIMFVVFPIMTWALYEIVNLDERIKEQLSEALNVYEIP